MFSTNELDPLVKDEACHTRAVYIAKLFNREGGVFKQDEIEYLEDCRLLTKTINRTKDAFDLIINETIDIKANVEAFRDLPSENKKREKIARARESVASKTIAFLQDETRSFVNERAGMGQEKVISTDGCHIPVLPLYLSAKQMLFCAASNNIPLIVNLFRMKLVTDEFHYDNGNVITYSVDVATKRFMPVDCPDDKVGIVIDMISCYVSNPDEKAGLFLCAALYSEFLSQFLQQDFATLFMVLAVGHDQYPKSAKVKKDETENVSAFEPERVIVGDFIVALEKNSHDEYSKLHGLATKYGMFSENSRYIKFNREKREIERPRETIPIFIDHVYAGTKAEAVAKSENLRSKNVRVSRISKY